MNREQTLKKAIEMVTGHREEDYGSPEGSFDLIARLWGDYLNRRITAVDVSAMMGLLKIGRVQAGQSVEDSLVDIAGYAACAAEYIDNHSVDPLAVATAAYDVRNGIT